MPPAATVRVVDVYPYRVAAGGGHEFLVLRRTAGRVYGGQWRMVGGKIEGGETAWQAALRELGEETGCTSVRVWALPSVNHFYDWRRDAVALIPAFAAELAPDAAVRLCDEHDVSAWLPAAEAAARLWWPEQQRLLLLTAELLERGGIPPELEVDGEG